MGRRGGVRKGWRNAGSGFSGQRRSEGVKLRYAREQIKLQAYQNSGTSGKHNQSIPPSWCKSAAIQRNVYPIRKRSIF